MDISCGKGRECKEYMVNDFEIGKELGRFKEPKKARVVKAEQGGCGGVNRSLIMQGLLVVLLQQLWIFIVSVLEKAIKDFNKGNH